MTGKEKIKCSADKFSTLLNLPRCEFDAAREHRLHYWEVTEAQLHLVMDPKLVGDEFIEANPKNLAYENKVLFYILCNSPMPTNRPENIQGIVANALLAIIEGIRFDVPYIFIRNLAYVVDNPQALKPYAPWIMFSITQPFEEKFFCPYVSNVFMHPVHDKL